jgi:hypothetical protein
MVVFSNLRGRAKITKLRNRGQDNIETNFEKVRMIKLAQNIVQQTDFMKQALRLLPQPYLTSR